MGKVPYG
jgi:IS30 family transposase